MKYDYLIVGAGFSGLVAAERLCNEHGKRCLIVEKRNHIGGNCHDCYDEHGVLIHPYGPHYFRTNSDEVLQYLSRFTEWIIGNYKVKLHCDDREWSFPINLETFEQYIGRVSNTDEMEEWLSSQRINFEQVTNSEEAVLSKVGKKWYDMFFKGYTSKQWNCHPSELSPSVCNRIPIRTVKDDRYFNDKHQCLPKHGYHKLFNNLVETCGDRLEIRLDTDHSQISDDEWSEMIFTGPIDAFFNHRLGSLPYRSLRFEREHHADEDLLQPCVQVNYSSADIRHTRTVESKHITKQKTKGTTIIREFPQDYTEGMDPYYPVPNEESKKLYEKYRHLSESLNNVHFLGRLGTYKYYNMDQVVAMTLKFAKNIS